LAFDSLGEERLLAATGNASGSASSTKGDKQNTDPSAHQNRGRFLPVYLPNVTHNVHPGTRPDALCISFHALLALRPRALFLVQDPVALRNTGFGFVVAVFTSTTTNPWSRYQHKRQDVREQRPETTSS
jgi:hypothetical protein